MRRGHQGIGGWRSENPRMFRQRNCDNSPYRTQRNYNQLNTSRYPLGSRPHRPHFNPHIGNKHGNQDQEWTRYRQESQFSFARAKDKEPHQKSFMKEIKHGDSSSNYKRSSHNSEGYLINNMGDIDQRQIIQNRIHTISPWNHDGDERNYMNAYNEKSHQYNKQTDYAGHRPPSSDHYGGNPIPTNENSNTFSRSVDDTVNIIRKRLLNREETHQTNEDIKDNGNHMHENIKTIESYSQYDQNLIKKKAPKPRKVSCERIKNKIVHQLFKMDKEKIHKLLDNPNSSTKFEYALNSLLTESQNSFNRHKRSVAEKSLCSSSKDFMQNDNNTIYEDTFMKQMQCILDPQDTILLEDIKPVVMAELSNLLQLDEVDSRYSYDQPTNYSYHNDKDPAEKYSQDYHTYNYLNKQECDNYYENFEVEVSNETLENSMPLYERRVRNKSITFSSDTDTGTGWRSSTKIDTEWNKPWDADNKDVSPRNEPSKSSDQSAPLFEHNSEFLEEEDTFAELDRQYHVVVDHNFIEDDELSNPIRFSPSSQQEMKSDTVKGHVIKKENDMLKPHEKNEIPLKDKIVNELQNFASAKLESLRVPTTEINSDENCNGQSMTWSVTKEAEKSQSLDIETKKKTNQLIHSETTETSTPTSNSRKRSIDRRPSHRKEKRKKTQDKDENKKLCQDKVACSINKDKMSSNSENMLNDVSKACSDPKQNKEKKFHLDNNKKIDTNDRNSSEKCVKDKETPIKAKTCEDRKRQNSTSSNHSTSPKNIACVQSTSSTKADSKSSLKSIDMFTEVPKKVNIHQAFRNTAVSNTGKQIAQIDKDKPLLLSNHKFQKCTRSHDPKCFLSKQTQTSKPSITSQCTQTSKPSITTQCTQTSRKRFARGIQVDLQELESKKNTKSTDALERMKQIDLEIQELLQEKFKLYSSLENTGGTAHIPMQNLGMTVLNVSSFENNKEDNEDEDIEETIVNNLSNIPAEELEQIAFESVESHCPSPAKSQRRQKQKVSSNIENDANSHMKNRNKAKTLNFSLIEQIITDDRPLEDIISLDNLETTPSKYKKKQVKPKMSKRKLSKTKKKKTQVHNEIDFKECYILLLREDLSKYMIGNKLKTEEETDKSNIKVNAVMEYSISPVAEESDVVSTLCEDLVEETVISSEIQFDMLDVSEDIVIGEIFDEKAVTEKEEQVAISEEIILDNSQSSIDDNTTPIETRGGECKLYDYLADENLQRDSLVANGNADAILAIESVGPNFLAAGLDGNVYYFNGDGHLISTLRGSNLAVTCLCVVKEKYGTTVYTGSLDSRIRNYDLETGLEKGPECNVLSPIQTMDRAWDTVFVGTRTGFVLQFECKNNLLIPVSTVKFSDQSILALRAMKEGPRKVLLVAARSENVTIKDAQTGLLLRTLNGPKMTVYTLLFEDGKVYCGTSSHQIQVFDYTSGSHVGTHEGGKGAVCLRAVGGLLFAGCYDGCIYVYREGEPRPFAQLRGPSLMLLCLTIVGTKIIAGFKDRSLYIWKIPLSILQEMIL
ncbi:uncharacterized protein LOC125049197 [Pieris napi]|uniref:uncharacterized protein LOC125049197 n=1 Tax=Pieris napi TaxID=78633 RepID=UPI001FB8E556|nr:uncharacterized protein LOC125049197 [Pieris napi]